MVSFADFRKKVLNFITQMEQEERLVLLKKNKAAAEIIPFSDNG